MNLTGTVTGVASGIYVQIPVLKAEYGPLSYVELGYEYVVGDRVLLVQVGTDEYVVAGMLRS